MKATLISFDEDFIQNYLEKDSSENNKNFIQDYIRNPLKNILFPIEVTVKKIVYTTHDSIDYTCLIHNNPDLSYNLCWFKFKEN